MKPSLRLVTTAPPLSMKTVKPPPIALQLARYAGCAIRWLWLCYVVRETRLYLTDCARDGLVHSLHLNHWAEQQRADIAHRDALLGQLKRGLQPWLV